MLNVYNMTKSEKDPMLPGQKTKIFPQPAFIS